MRDRRLRHVLDRDMLQEFQEKTGHSYKDPAQGSAVLAYALPEIQRQRAALLAAGDTVWCHDFDDYMAKVLALGFRVLRQVNCWTTYYGHARRVVKPAYELWHDTHGVLFSLVGSDAEGRRRIVDGANIFFNWREGTAGGPRGCSGSWAKDAAGAWVYVGSKDLRTGLCFEWQELLDAGTFVTPWIECPRVYLQRPVALATTHTDPDWYPRYRRIRDHRISTLPPEILAKMGWKPEASV